MAGALSCVRWRRQRPARPPRAISASRARFLLLAGHDTNLSNLSGMIGLSWKLAGYQPDDTPPGGALIFAL